jgi:hypothetical protein
LYARLDVAGNSRRIPVTPGPGRHLPTRARRDDICGLRRQAVEFLNFVLMFAAAYLVWRNPGRERLAYGFLVTCTLLMVACFLIASRGSVLPGLNY